MCYGIFAAAATAAVVVMAAVAVVVVCGLIMQGVKAAGLFIASAVCFCDDSHSEQCLTSKFIGGVALVGLLIRSNRSWLCLTTSS